MNKIRFVLVSSMLGIGLTLTAHASAGKPHEVTSPSMSNLDKAEYYRTGLQPHQDKAVQLLNKIEQLQNQISSLDAKPYLDPKGFKRNEWKRLVETWRQDLMNALDQMVLHESELKRLQASTKEMRVDGERKEDVL